MARRKPEARARDTTPEAPAREPLAPDEGTPPAVRDYTIVCIVAVLVVGVVLNLEGLGMWALVPTLIGSVAVVARWSAGPPILLLLVTVGMLARGWLEGHPPWYRPPSSPLSDVLLAAALVVFVVCHLRLQTLASHGVPPDHRRERRPSGRRLAGRWLLPRERWNRSPEHVPPGEIGVLLLAVPAFVALAYLLWVRVAVEPAPQLLGLPAAVWHALLVVWVAGLALVVTSAVLNHLGRTQASPEEAHLFLQDELWAATRGEQRRINRWTAWARLRAQRRRERP